MKLFLQQEISGQQPPIPANILAILRLFTKHLPTPTRLIENTDPDGWCLELDTVTEGPGFTIIDQQLCYQAAEGRSVTLGQFDGEASFPNMDGRLLIQLDTICQLSAVCADSLNQQLEQKKSLLTQQLKDQQYTADGISYICPITLDLIQDPVQAPDGFIYERSALKEHLNSRHASATRSPSTNAPFENLAHFKVDTAPQNQFYRQMVNARFPAFAEIQVLEKELEILTTPLPAPASAAPVPQISWPISVESLSSSLPLFTTPLSDRNPVAITPSATFSALPPAEPPLESRLTSLSSWFSSRPSARPAPVTTPTQTLSRMTIIVVGDRQAEKAALISRYTDGHQASREIGIDFKTRSIRINDQSIRLLIWDTAGQESFVSRPVATMRKAHAVILAYNPQSQASFDYVQTWLNNAEQRQGVAESTTIHLTATHCASGHRVITDAMGRQLAQAHGIGYSECDTQHDLNVEHPFETVAQQVWLNHQHTPTAPRPGR